MSNQSAVSIEERGPWEFTNIKNGHHYSVIRADQILGDEKNLHRLVSICNEIPIYDFLFRNFLKGEPYALANAKSFLTRAEQGWQNQNHFVFAAVDSRGEICGALDIKSNDRKKAEIGYWASGEHSGIANPAVRVMCKVAEDAGFESLFAFVKTSNPKSISVLELNGFLKEPEVDHSKNYPRFLYSRTFGKSE